MHLQSEMDDLKRRHASEVRRSHQWCLHQHALARLDGFPRKESLAGQDTATRTVRRALSFLCRPAPVNGQDMHGGLPDALREVVLVLRV